MVISNRWRYFLSVQGREVEVGEGEISLGRSQSANVSVKDASVSRNHALMHAQSGRLTVKDLNSSNGTFLNGMRIFAEAELHDGDALTLGESEMRVRILPPESVAATMRIDPRALLAGEELRLQAEEEAKAALVPGAVPARSPLPPPPSALSHVPRSSAAAPPSPRLPLAAVDLSAPASADTGPTPLPARPAPVVPPPSPAAVAPAPKAPPPMPAPTPPAMPPMSAPVAMPPLAPASVAAAVEPHQDRPSPPPAPRPAVEAAPEAPSAVRAPAPPAAMAAPAAELAAEPAPAEAAPEADLFALPDLDLPPLPPVEVTKVSGPQPIVPRAAPVAPMNTRPAGFWLRSVAVILDSLLLGLICGGLFLATGNVLDDEQRVKLISVVWFVLDFGMRIVGWSLWGTTPGKLLLGLRVFPAGSPVPGIGFGKALLRYVGYGVSGAVLGIGFLMVAFTKGKRGLHDMIAGTTVGKTSRAA